MKDDIPFLSWLTDLTLLIFNEEFKKEDNTGSIETDNISSELSEKIKPETDIWKQIFNEINEIKIKKSEEEEQVELQLEEEQTEEEKEARLEKEGQKKIAKKKIKREKREVLKGKLFDNLKRPADKIILVLAVIVIAAGIYYLINILSASAWEVISEKGVPKIESVELTGKEFMKPGFTLVTNSKSSAVIKIPYVGNIKVKEGTIIKRLPSNYAFNLQKGSIIASKGNAKEFLTIEIPSAEISDYYLGGYYNLDVDEAGNTLLYVNDGWEIVKGIYNESLVPPNFYCEIRKNEDVGIPFSQSASGNLISALRIFSFEKMPAGQAGENQVVLDLILKEAQITDAISLWHLLKRVDYDTRSKIFNVLYGLVPPSKIVTQEGILKLNSSMLQSWLEEIELAM